MTEFSIIRPGSEVYMADGTIEGIVLEASISGMYRVKYQVAWWDKAEHKTAWVDALELMPKKDETLPIGFAAEVK